jgi:hypothetical protein
VSPASAKVDAFFVARADRGLRFILELFMPGRL